MKKQIKYAMMPIARENTKTRLPRRARARREGTKTQKMEYIKCRKKTRPCELYIIEGGGNWMFNKIKCYLFGHLPETILLKDTLCASGKNINGQLGNDINLVNDTKYSFLDISYVKCKRCSKILTKKISSKVAASQLRR